MARATKAQQARRETLEARLRAAEKEVFAVVAPRTDVRFLDCLAHAPEPVAARYHGATADLDTFDRSMVAAGRAYWSEGNRFTWQTC